tara:strand:+ start:4156 stop:4380 length:225 start_codon:yes stop_codon:yes gene_type:complete
MDTLQEALVRLVSKFESEELGLSFARQVCNMLCSEIIPVIHENPEEATRLLASTDKDFVDGLLKLISQKQSSNL